MKKRIDWREVGGAPLVGVNGVGFIGHGRSDALADRERDPPRRARRPRTHFIDEIAHAVAPSDVARSHEPPRRPPATPTPSPRRRAARRLNFGGDSCAPIIAGTGSYAPEKVVTNAELEKLVETNDQWIVERTGIRERRVAAPERGHRATSPSRRRERALEAAQPRPEGRRG